jgi:hypothetical protein
MLNRRKADDAPGQEPEFERVGERWVRSVKQECLPKLVLLGEGPLQRSLTEFGALSSGTQLSGQRQQAVDAAAGEEGSEAPLPPTAGRVLEVLRLRRMSILAYDERRRF